MNLRRESREKLKAMSVKAFGSSSKWQTIMNKPKFDHIAGKSVLPTLKVVYKAMIELIKRKEGMDEISNAE